MMNLEDFVGKLTQTETAQLLYLLWSNMTSDQKYAFVEENRAQINEILENL